MKRIVIFTEDGHLVVAMETISIGITVSAFCAKPHRKTDYKHIAIFPADRPECANAVASALGDALQIPITFGRD